MTDVEQLTAQLEAQQAVNKDTTTYVNGDGTVLIIQGTNVVDDKKDTDNAVQENDASDETAAGVCQDTTNNSSKAQCLDANNSVSLTQVEDAGDITMMDVSLASQNSESATLDENQSGLDTPVASRNSQLGIPSSTSRKVVNKDTTTYVNGDGTVLIIQGTNVVDDKKVTDNAVQQNDASDETAAGVFQDTTNNSSKAQCLDANNSVSLTQVEDVGDITMMDVSLASQNSESATLDENQSGLDTPVASQNSQLGTPSSTSKKVGKWSKYKKRYNAKWEKEPGLMEWIRRVPGNDSKVMCRFCQNTHRAHRTELRRHANSIKHKSQSAFVVLPGDSFNSWYSYVPRMFKCMRVIRVTEWGDPEVLEVFSDVSMPEPENEQVLIKVGAIGVNPVDAYIRSGQYANLPNLPWTPGADCAGTVEHVGHLVTKYRHGDRVYTNGSLTGTYAEYTLCDESNVFHLPDQLDFKGGAALGIPYFTAYRALVQRAKARPGQTVLIHGASGSVGMAAVQFARAYGMTVLGTAGTEEGMTLVRQFGAHFAFNHRHDDYTDQILTATEGDGVDVVIEMLANVNLQKDLELLAIGGTIAIVGNRGTVEINPRLLMPKESSIVGVMLPRSTKKERKEVETAIKAGIESGWIRPHIGMEFSIEGAALAHEELMAGNGSQGRIVLVM